MNRPPAPDDRQEFEVSRRRDAARLGGDAQVRSSARRLFAQADEHNFSYMWNWCGVPIIQNPEDIVVMQEILWETRPDVVIELGVARGGSLILYSSILNLVGKGRVIGVDIDIRPHNRQVIESHPLGGHITLIEGSSTDPAVLDEVQTHIGDDAQVAVILDSNHTHEHVLNELRLYAPLVTAQQFLVVADTIVEEIPEQGHRPREWGPGNNPMTALRAFMQESNAFVEDSWINSKLLLTSSPGGYLRRVQ